MIVVVAHTGGGGGGGEGIFSRVLGWHLWNNIEMRFLPDYSSFYAWVP